MKLITSKFRIKQKCFCTAFKQPVVLITAGGQRAKCCQIRIKEMQSNIVTLTTITGSEVDSDLGNFIVGFRI